MDEKTSFAIYSYDSNYYEEQKQVENPFEIDKEFIELHADHYSERMAAQRGFFTLHRHPNKPFRVDTLVKFTFPPDIRDDVLYELDFYGINKASLFPGLDGIAEYWSWFYRIATGFEES
jgi:hypothetical protein